MDCTIFFPIIDTSLSLIHLFSLLNFIYFSEDGEEIERDERDERMKNGWEKIKQKESLEQEPICILYLL